MSRCPQMAGTLILEELAGKQKTAQADRSRLRRLSKNILNKTIDPNYITQFGSAISWSECDYRISDYQVRPYQIEAQRSGFDLERRSGGVSAL